MRRIQWHEESEKQGRFTRRHLIVKQAGPEGPLPFGVLVPINGFIARGPCEQLEEVKYISFHVGPRVRHADGRIGRWLVIVANNLWLETLVSAWNRDAVLQAQYELIRLLLQRRMKPAPDVELIGDIGAPTWQEDLARAKQRHPEYFAA